MPASVGTRASSKRQPATICTMNQESPITSFMRPFPGTTLSSAVAIMLWYWTAQPLASYTRHIAMYSILRHTTPSQQEARRLRFVPEEQTPKAIHRPTKGLGSTCGRKHPIRGFSLITATLALIVLAEQRYKLKSPFSLLAETSILSLSLVCLCQLSPDSQYANCITTRGPELETLELNTIETTVRGILAIPWPPSRKTQSS